ncbi:uncharacterized protein LOC135497262 [Lineus longissimus]|uniref:uncharacterized protein LOC135497262 n=1 Tax=Lineus longissimus TaxID=88925 RepID=UPI00315CCE60
MLNRIRVRPKQQPLAPQNHAMLLSRLDKTIPDDTLHIFPTRKEVDNFNHMQLNSTSPNIQHIPPLDVYKQNKRPRKATPPTTTTQLPGSKPDTLAKHAQVMLTQNIDVADGLVNGACGTITHIPPPGPNTKVPPYICVHYLNHHTGLATKRCQTTKDAIPQGSIIIKHQPVHDQPTSNNFVRHQFPISLAWTCTAHKVQGVTTHHAAVALKHIFTPGQAYVALSRVTSLQGLYLLDDTFSKIYCNAHVTETIQTMPTANISPAEPISNIHTTDHFIITHHNIEGLQHHMPATQNTQIQHAQSYASQRHGSLQPIQTTTPSLSQARHSSTYPDHTAIPKPTTTLVNPPINYTPPCSKVGLVSTSKNTSHTQQHIMKTTT